MDALLSEAVSLASSDYHTAAMACYLAHVEGRHSIRSIAARTQAQPSTIIRRIRKIEAKRDDPLVDRYLESLVSATPNNVNMQRGNHAMAAQCRPAENPKDRKLEKDQFRVLRRLCETGCFLVLSEGLEKAAIMRQTHGGEPTRSGVADTSVAAALVLRDWIECTKLGRIACYKVTSAGRAALKRKLARSGCGTGFAEAPSVFAEQHKDWGEKVIPEPDTARPRKMRINLRESPLNSLGRKKDKDGRPFLTPALLGAGERLREDFELAQLGPRVAQNWERFLTAGNRGSFGSSEGGSSEAHRRLSEALAALGPGLGDIEMRCCCFPEGLEAAEKRMGWSARSGKIVLRIALQRLCAHYEEMGGDALRKIG